MDADDPRHPLDPRDFSRRTLLANERTYLAWLRTGLATLTVSLAAARIVPELSNSETTWPYTAVGVGFAVLGIICIVYGEHRRSAVDRSLRTGEFAELDPTVSLILTGLGVLLGLAIVAIVLVNP